MNEDKKEWNCGENFLWQFRHIPALYIIFLGALTIVTQSKRYLWVLVVLVLGYFIVTPLLKGIFNQLGCDSYRPHDPLEAGFPSGHAFAVCFMASWAWSVGCDVPVVFLLVLLGILTMYQRYYFGFHDTNQLLGGAILGVTVGVWLGQK
jgi:membrane-associated phospholipid phosphatase